MRVLDLVHDILLEGLNGGHTAVKNAASYYDDQSLSGGLGSNRCYCDGHRLHAERGK
jgi:hypothetical protein